MKRRIFLTSTLGAAASGFLNLAHAAEAPPETLAAPVEGVQPLRCDEPRIGDIAPEFAFPGLNKKLWSLRDVRGKAPVILALTGDAPVLVSERSTPAQALVAIAEAAEQLKKAEITTVLISKAIGIDIGAFNEDLALLGLRDGDGTMAKLFNVSQTSVTLVAIDRAGFLRRVEAVRDIADVAPMMMEIGDPTPRVVVGKLAPDFAMADMNGHVRRLADLRGQKNLLISFFPKCFTGGCANQLSSLRAERDAFANADTQIWAVSIDPARSIDNTGQDRGQIAFAAALGLDFPLFPDTGRNLCLLYGTVENIQQVSRRWTFLIDKEGVLRFVDKDVQSRLTTHGPDCLAKTRELGMFK